jgi:D-alanyl-D-alanine carboxypeptidase/D-alanyl-D-alanine-endopeptidase (penicillin-binding protein 4)
VPSDRPAGPEAACLAQTRTPLTTVLSRCNTDSLNLAAECLLLRAGTGAWPGSAELAGRTVTETFDLPPGSVVLRDGGGLSRGNRLSPRAVTGLLSGMDASRWREPFVASLAVSGAEGTMANRLTDEAYRGRVRAKTGYIRGASALSGYVLDDADRPRLAFSVLVNRVPAGRNWQAKQFQDAVCREVVDRARDEQGLAAPGSARGGSRTAATTPPAGRRSPRQGP